MVPPVVLVPVVEPGVVFVTGQGVVDTVLQLAPVDVVPRAPLLVLCPLVLGAVCAGGAIVTGAAVPVVVVEVPIWF